MREEFLEDGIVIESEKGVAEIALVSSDNCEECSAKLFCKPKSDNTKILKVTDPFDTRPGDEVRISVAGSTVLKVTFLIYGIPLILFIAGILLGMDFYKNSSAPEVLSFISGLLLMGIYFLLFYFFSQRNRAPVLPKITFVKRTPSTV